MASTDTGAEAREVMKHDKRSQKSDASALTATPERKNTSVYVTGLPEDATVEELKDHFVKCGIIMEDAVTGAPKIKIYSDEEGRLKGDALIMYFKIESVDLAVDLLDESYLRPNVQIHVQKATFSSTAGAGTLLASNEKSHDLKMKKKKLEDMRRKLDWEEETELEGKPDEPFRKIVLLKHVFLPSELEMDPSLALDLKQDIESECSKLGTVNSIQLFESSAEGAVTIKYMDELSAMACINKLQGRFYGGRRLEATLLDPETKRLLKMEHKLSQRLMKSDQVESHRLEAYGRWLETGERPEPNGSVEPLLPQMASPVDAAEGVALAASFPLASSEAAAAYATIEEGESLADRLRKKRKLQNETGELEGSEQDPSYDDHDDLFEEETV